MDEQQNQDETFAVSDPISTEDIKERALAALIPLADKIEGEPEQKFGMLMSAVRVSHSVAILEKALNCAEQMQDDSQKAEALIDVINEANYQASQAA